MVPEPPPERRLPYSRWWPFLAGVAIGLLLRFAFNSKPGEAYSTMQGSFILLTPLVVGMVTVFIAESMERRTWGYYMWAPATAMAFLVFGSLLIMIEGMICALLIIPLFMAFGAIGGLIMGVVFRSGLWPRQTVASFAMLPLMLGAVEGRSDNPERVRTVQRSVVIAAPAETIWQQLHDLRAIKPEEVEHGWIYRIGVPLPISGVTEQTPEGPVRRVSMGKSIHFDQVARELEPNRHVLWTYRFTEDSFPPAALDDHVRIGGHYFDLRNTAYTLTPVTDGTRVTVSMEYRVSTRFNWYVDPLARLLIGNVEEVLLDLYKARSEAAAS